jgi:hypothetical protein
MWHDRLLPDPSHLSSVITVRSNLTATELVQLNRSRRTMLESITTPGLTSVNGLVHAVCLSDALRKSNPSFSILLTSASPSAPRQGSAVSERKFRNSNTLTNFPYEWEALLDRVHARYVRRMLMSLILCDFLYDAEQFLSRWPSCWMSSLAIW